MANEERNPEICVEDDLHILFGVSYGFHLVHDFLFTNGRISWAAADEAVEQLLAGLGLPAEFADEFAEQ